MRKKKKEKKDDGLSTTMMVDVLFILLIFFILISKIKTDSLKVKAQTVKSNQTTVQNKKQTVQHSITIDKKNEIYIDGKKSGSLDDLQKSLLTVKQQIPKDATPLITLRTDAESSSGKLIELFAALNEAGLGDFVQCEVNTKE